MKKKLILAAAAAEYLGVTTRTLANWRSTGKPSIPYYKIGRCVRYRIEDLESYIERHIAG